MGRTLTRPKLLLLICFFLGGFLKDNVCEKHLLSILQLKSEVTANVKLAECVQVMFRCTCNAMGYIWSTLWKGPATRWTSRVRLS